LEFSELPQIFGHRISKLIFHSLFISSQECYDTLCLSRATLFLCILFCTVYVCMLQKILSANMEIQFSSAFFELWKKCDASMWYFSHNLFCLQCCLSIIKKKESYNFHRFCRLHHGYGIVEGNKELRDI
jgi:hypothetical protein